MLVGSLSLKILSCPGLQFPLLSFDCANIQLNLAAAMICGSYQLDKLMNDLSFPIKTVTLVLMSVILLL